MTPLAEHKKQYLRRDSPVAPALILCGGRGTRLGTICDNCPKPMLPVADKPFVEHIVRFLHGQGIRRFVFLTGYLGDHFPRHFAGLRLAETEFRFIKEKTPLGTGGAIASAIRAAAIRTPFIALNADSFAPFNAALLLAAATGHDGALVGVRIDDVSRYGSLQVTPDDLLAGFREKQAKIRNGIINAGIYCLTPRLFDDLEHGKNYSIERDLFPLWLKNGRRFAVATVNGPFLDIGTPESLGETNAFARTVFEFGGRRTEE